jgi:4-hydroxy-3-methylbut-2-enyl diphosphate reductase IspH
VRHEIVHNKHVVNTLKNKGARFVEELDEVPDGAVTVFSAHGVPQSWAKTAQRATCPFWTPPARWCPRSTIKASVTSPRAAP